MPQPRQPLRASVHQRLAHRQPLGHHPHHIARDLKVLLPHPIGREHRLRQLVPGPVKRRQRRPQHAGQLRVGARRCHQLGNGDKFRRLMLLPGGIRCMAAGLRLVHPARNLGQRCGKGGNAPDQQMIHYRRQQRLPRGKMIEQRHPGHPGLRRHRAHGKAAIALVHQQLDAGIQDSPSRPHAFAHLAPHDIRRVMQPFLDGMSYAIRHKVSQAVDAPIGKSR